MLCARASDRDESLQYDVRQSGKKPKGDLLFGFSGLAPAASLRSPVSKAVQQSFQLESHSSPSYWLVRKIGLRVKRAFGLLFPSPC